MIRQQARRELHRNWPILGTALILWAAAVTVRLAVGFETGRIVAIVIMSVSMLVIGIMAERIHRINQQEKMEERR